MKCRFKISGEGRLKTSQETYIWCILYLRGKLNKNRTKLPIGHFDADGHPIYLSIISESELWCKRTGTFFSSYRKESPSRRHVRYHAVLLLPFIRIMCRIRGIILTCMDNGAAWTHSSRCYSYHSRDFLKLKTARAFFQ